MLPYSFVIFVFDFAPTVQFPSVDSMVRNDFLEISKTFLTFGAVFRALFVFCPVHCEALFLVFVARDASTAVVGFIGSQKLILFSFLMVKCPLQPYVSLSC